MHFHPNPMSLWDYEVISPGFPTGGFRSSDASTPTQMDHSSFSSFNHTPEQSLHLDLHHQLNYHAWAASQDHNNIHHTSMNYQHMDNLNEQQMRNTSVIHPSYGVNSTHTSGDNPMSSAFSEWGSSQATPAWTPAHQSDNPFDDKRLLLQQATVPFAVNHTNHQSVSNNDSHPAFQNSGNPSAHGNVQHGQPQGQIHAPIPIQVHQQQPPVISSSPDYSSFISTQEPQINAESMSRRDSRGSNSSDLVNGLDTIHLQRVQSHPSSDEEVFKTPPIPNLNLATRRKRPRPAAIGTVGMRSHSCTAPHDSSPNAKATTLGLSQSVRRIKSTGNSLNVLSGRVQKSSVPAQRSPLNFQTFHEAGAFDHVDAFSGQPANNSEVSLNSTVGPLTPHTPSVAEDHSSIWNKPTLPFESGATILHEDPYSSGTGDGPLQVTSPPRTPAYTELSMYNTPPFSHTPQPCPPPPQSAPPQLTTFPNYSPPFQPVPTTPMNYIVPQGLHDTYGYHQVAQIPQSHVQMYHYPIQPTYFPVLPPQTVHHSPLVGTHYNFQSANNPPPQKEMEFIIQNFPASKDAVPRPSKSPQQYTEYVFQNSGPGDF